MIFGIPLLLDVAVLLIFLLVGTCFVIIARRMGFPSALRFSYGSFFLPIIIWGILRNPPTLNSAFAEVFFWVIFATLTAMTLNHFHILISATMRSNVEPNQK
jgi:hypothetical protein